MPNVPAQCVLVEPSSSMQQCMGTYGTEGEGEWVNNSISRGARFWSCGAVTRRQAVTLKHDHDVQELARCRSLAKMAADSMGMYLEMLRSEADPETQPYFITAQRSQIVPERIDENLIRTALGGTLHPDSSVVIEPFSTRTQWWKDLDEDARESAEISRDPSAQYGLLLKPWRELLEWFPANGLGAPSFVKVSRSSKGSHTLGCVFPCFIVGITDKGSIVGIATHVVE